MSQIVCETDGVIGGTLFTEAISAVEGPTSTYLDRSRHNVGPITEAFGS